MCLLSSCSYISILFVSERARVISIPFFKSCVAKTDICFLRFRGGDLCLVNNVCHATVSVYGG